MRIRSSKSDVGGTDAPTPTPVSVPSRSSGWPGSELLNDPTPANVLFRVWSGDPAVIVPSPPGSGKTRLTVKVAQALAHRAGLRVAIAAQTRAQAAQIADRLAPESVDRARHIVSAREAKQSGRPVPVVTGKRVAWPQTGGAIMVATMARWLFSSVEDLRADVLIVDEAWQCTYGDLGAAACMAGQVVLVGDPGQIDPVVTGTTRRWEDSPTGPHVPAPDGLIAAHGADSLAIVRLRHTWRLGPVTTRLVSGLFYAPRGLPFSSNRPDECLLTDAGEGLPEIAHRQVSTTSGPGDPALAVAAAERVRELLRLYVVTAEGTSALSAGDVAVVVPHVAQANQIAAQLAVDAPEVLVGTANALQGLERRAVVAYHPLAGKRTASSFATDAGRACVTLSRHRAHLTVLCDPDSPVLDDTDDRDARTLAALTHRLEDSPEV